MDKESRQSYNKNYYENNKDRILEKLKSKVNCAFCNRTVSFCNLQKHYVLPICKATQEKNKYISERKNNI
jgi:hypothetical protein